MAKLCQLALTITFASFLLLCSTASAEEHTFDERSVRLLAGANLIDSYSIFLNGHIPVLEQGALKAPFAVTSKDLNDVLNTNKTLEGIAYESVDTEQFFQLYITTTEKTKPEYKLEVSTSPGLGVRIVDHPEELWEHTTGSMEAFYHFTFKEYTRNERFWVQFFCEKDGRYEVSYTITPNPDTFSISGSEVHPSISFRTAKTCVKGPRTDFMFTPMDLWKNTMRDQPFHVVELTTEDPAIKTNITYKMARTYFEVKVLGPDQVIIQPEIKSLDETLGVGLLGKGVRGGVASPEHMLEFIFAFECYQKNGTDETDLRGFTFSFLPPPFDRVTVPMWVDCKHFDSNKTFFPFNVGTFRNTNDVILKGKTVSNYQVPMSGKASEAQIVNIPPEVGATEFFIYLEPHPPSANKSSDDFEFDWFERVDAIAADHILDPEIVNIPTRGVALTKDVQRMVLVYNCKRPGKTAVTVSFHQHDHGYDFNVIKHCPTKAVVKQLGAFWRFLFAAGVIFFGCFLVTVLRALIQKEHSASGGYSPAQKKGKAETEMSSSGHSRVQTVEDNI